VFDSAAAREVEELERLMERPAAAQSSTSTSSQDRLNIYQFADSAHPIHTRLHTELEERSSPAWAMPL